MTLNLLPPPEVHLRHEKRRDGTKQRLKRIFLVNSCFVLLPSYVLHYYLGLEINSLFLIIGTASLIVCLHETRGRLHRGLMALVLVLLMVGSIGSLLSGTYSQLLMAASLSVSAIVGFNGWRLFSDRRTLNYLTLVGWVLVAGAVIAVIYAYSGNPPLAKIDLLGRDSYLYLTTFTNAISGNLIRSAGIFDEPGALAMYLTIIVALNEALGENTKWTAALLFTGLVTGSFALLIVGIAYLIFIGQQKRLFLVGIVLTTVSILVAVDDRVANVADHFFFERAKVVDGRLSGDNRTHQIKSFFETVDWDMTLSGQKAAGKDYGERDVSSNPFSIYYGYGAVIWIPYLALELWLLYCAFFYRPHLRFPAFALFVTLLQRPYIYSMYWGMMIAVLVVVIYRVQVGTKTVGRRNVSTSLARVALGH